MTANGNPQLNFNSPNPDVMNAFLAQFTQQGGIQVPTIPPSKEAAAPAPTSTDGGDKEDDEDA